jgi:hypothetical protein
MWVYCGYEWGGYVCAFGLGGSCFAVSAKWHKAKGTMSLGVGGFTRHDLGHDTASITMPRGMMKMPRGDNEVFGDIPMRSCTHDPIFVQAWNTHTYVFTI